ncbi:MAG: hypothetical protein HWN66_01065 [Candidatus Helarchaeota archaeon]|nr:hypothetical protein [Candidatus Helarchaeota archaeon]
MDELGKWFASVGMICVGVFLIILSLILGPADLIPVISVGIALCGFGGFIFYLRHLSITSESRVQKVKVTRVVREVPKPKPKPAPKPEPIEVKPKKPEILCDTCRFYDEYHPRRKCRYLTDKDRMAMINAGMECVEYKIKLTLLDEG